MAYRYYAVFRNHNIRTSNLNHLYKKVLEIIDNEAPDRLPDALEQVFIWDGQLSAWLHLSIPNSIE